MEVRNYDCNGKFIPDLSKVVLPDELSIALFKVFEEDAQMKAEEKIRRKRKINKEFKYTEGS
ncbi:hypothetical protein [Enterococcus faecium]|uniref:hypothetical protein n=1 Tax=Enterococcus faecium TaxID=1352 RepID=UPI000531ABE1|nr:hypothetical protein [Enterococcus faecium]KGQ79528.1 hypothetical protein OP03_00395 [Enterococcus faecium]MBK4830795.1 hypothetical protein [Enterococcus faecium]MBK4859956.1 hypothetical protein [Enterococcus faecium]BDP45666.1 hypothetical protein EfmJHP9_05360 [Enterococcus faecium]BDP49111.1 hypothetical protein EfmJHP10_05470 [Enterococcus faecium]